MWGKVAGENSRHITEFDWRQSSTALKWPPCDSAEMTPEQSMTNILVPDLDMHNTILDSYSACLSHVLQRSCMFTDIMLNLSTLKFYCRPSLISMTSSRLRKPVSSLLKRSNRKNSPSNLDLHPYDICFCSDICPCLSYRRPRYKSMPVEHTMKLILEQLRPPRPLQNPGGNLSKPK
jgi:hypothetical protein